MPLTATDITFGYRPGREVLRGVSLAFEPGTVTALLGPNGAGKSTLLRILLGALRPQHGEAALDGESITNMPARRRAERIAYIPQRATVSAPFTVGQVVRLGRYARPADEGAVRRAMDTMQVAEMAEEAFATLSAGQQQRVVMARAFAQLAGETAPHRRVILADEPCAAMDPRHELHAMRALREQARSGAAVVIVLHDFTAAARFADSAALLGEDGRIAAAGPAERTIRARVLEEVFGVPFLELPGARGDGRPGALIPGGATDQAPPDQGR